MVEDELQLNWKKQYEYNCLDCGKKRYTKRKTRAIDKVCTICEKARDSVNENQKTIFDK